MADAVEGLTLDRERMRANLGITQGLVLAEAAMIALGEKIGRAEAHHLVEAASRTAAASGRHLRDVLAEDEAVTRHLDRPALERLFEPQNYLGSAAAFVDAALARHAPKA
jgi:3-carboxy-cis,cis-muconate cycloisomerase